MASPPSVGKLARSDTNTTLLPSYESLQQGTSSGNVDDVEHLPVADGFRDRDGNPFVPSALSSTNTHNMPPVMETQAQVPEQSITANQPPTYTFIDNQVRSFMLIGTFIFGHDLSRPLYQLSRGLDGGRELHIRRLNQQESEQWVDRSPTPLPFDKSSALYSLTLAPLSVSNIEIAGKRRSAFPGNITMRRRFEDWHVHQGTSHSRGLELFKSKQRSGLKKQPLQWIESASGEVLGTEVQQTAVACDAFLELQKTLDEKQRELLVTCWIALLWQRHTLL
jgi:hypothetical protein